MSVPAYRDIYIGSTTSNGVVLSDTLASLYRRWGNSTEAINGAIENCSSIHVSYGDAVQAAYVTPYPKTKEQIYARSITSSTKFAYVYYGVGFQPWVDRYKRTQLDTNATYELGGSYWSSAGLQAKFILANFDRSRYINLVSVNARNLAGQQCGNKTLRDYKDNFAASYPYIISMSYSTCYKSNLQGTGYSNFPIGLIGNTSTMVCKFDVFNDMSPKYRENGHYYRMAAPNFNINLPPLTVATKTKPDHSTDYYSFCKGNGNACCFDYFSTYTGDIDNRITPFNYMTVSDVTRWINRMGLWWAESVTAVQNAHGEATTDPDVHAPVIDNNGYITDDYLSGDPDPDNNEIYQYFTQGGTDPGIFNPLGDYDITGNNNIGNNEELKPQYETQNPDPLKPGDEDLELENTDYNGVGLFGTYWCGSRASIRAFNDKLWNVNEPNFILQVLEGLKLYGADPINSIMSLRLYPFNVGVYAQTEGFHNVILGTVDMGFSMLKISDAASVKFELGSIQIQPKYNNFLDLAPYTAMTLYVPFVGSMQLNVNDFLGKSLRVQMTVDLTTGQCVACIYANETPMLHASGQMGVEIPISAKTFADVSMAVVESAATAIVGAATGMIGIASAVNFKNFEVTGSKMSAAERRSNYVENAIISEDNNTIKSLGSTVTHNMGELFFGGTSIDRTGSISSGNSLTMPIYCYLVVSRPNVEMPDDYNHTYGRVCHKSGQLIGFSGYTVCSNVDTSGITATEQERSAIKAFLESGVYL